MRDSVGPCLSTWARPYGRAALLPLAALCWALAGVEGREVERRPIGEGSAQRLLDELELLAEEDSAEGGREDAAAGKEFSEEADGEDGKESSGERSEEAGESEEGEGEGKEEQELGEMEHIDIAIGCMLLGSIAMQMGLLYLVNYPDEDIMKSSWEVISSTISIFTSVLIFHAFLGLFAAVEEDQTHRGESEVVTGGLEAWASIGFSLAFFLFIFVVMHVVIAGQVKSHEMEEPPIDQSQAEALRVSFQNTTETKKQRRKRITKSWAILLAHTASFAGIHLGVRVMALSIFERVHCSAFIVPMLLAGLFFVLFRLSDWCRGHGSEGLSMEAHEAWDDEAEEAEKDIASIALSFLICQASRYTIVGKLARSNGMEVPQEVHPWTCIMILMLVGLAFYLLTAIMVTMIATEHSAEQKTPEGSKITLLALDHVSHAGLDPMNVYVMRWRKIFPKITASCGSWCLLWSCKWGQLLVPQPGGIHFDKNSTVMFVALALFISLVMFVLILVLDFLADLTFTGPICDVSLRAIIDSLGVLVGYTWELSFSSGMDGIAELSAGFGKWAPALCQIALAIVISIVVVPAWRANILKKVLELQEMEAAKAAAEARLGNGGAYEALSPSQSRGDQEARALSFDAEKVQQKEHRTRVSFQPAPLDDDVVAMKTP